MNQAAEATRATGTEAERLSQRREGIETLGKSLFAVGGLAAAGVALAVAKYAEFDQAISSVQAATHATAADMDLLRQAAIDAGGATVFSATESANAIEELAKAGLTTQQILGGGLNGALSLASAGGLEVADAANIAAVAVKQFNLQGSDVPHVADLLAAGAGKAVGDVSDLAAALGQSGLVAKGMGLSIEETTGTLAAFADQGLIGSDAGTSFKTMLQSLVPSSVQAKTEMDRLGISAFDASGKFIGISQFAGNYKNALKDLSPEQQAATSKIIFGSDAVRASNVLLDLGAAGIQKYIDQTNDQGYAAETARIKLDNLRGDVEKLGGSFDTALIQSGSGANGTLRDLTQSATFLVDSFGSAPPELLNVGLALTVLVGAIGLVGGGALLAVPKIVAFRAAMNGVSGGAKAAALGVGVLSAGLAIATVVVGSYVAQQAEIKATTAELVDTLDKATGATTNYTRAAIARKLSEDGSFEAAKKAGVGQTELTDAILKGGDAYDSVQKKIVDTNTFQGIFDGTSLGAYNAGQNISKLRTSVEDSGQAFIDQAAVADKAASATENISGAIDGVAISASDAKGDIESLKSTIEGFGKTQLDVNGATRDFEASLDDLQKTLATNGATLDIGTEQGRANQAGLDDIAKSTLALSSATLSQTGSQEDAAAAIQNGRDQLIAALDQFGINGQAAQDYADKLGLIPGSIATSVAVTGSSEAIQQAMAVANAIATIPGYRETVINQVIKQTGAPRGEVGAAYADGGQVTGPGPIGKDSVVAMLAPGEHVLTATDVSRMGGQAAVYGFRQSLASAPHYATGGAVTASPTIAPVVAGAQVQVDVHPSAGTDERVIGQTVANDLNWRLAMAK
ncbi:phage tail tape measure protein [Subtercola boreus]|uniref:Phage tail tape measure protein n=1 Tax=Subtercola boreus TaxID=120213 RepID=A0A3E0VWU8_9MICO|nr:phage tail tape measure protein [Subtercola boreus]RFA14554.1 phage tail tape measure protein [Subtercola boreus]